MIKRNGLILILICLLASWNISGQSKEKLLVEYSLLFHSGILQKSGLLLADEHTALFREGVQLEGDRISLTEDGNIIAIDRIEDSFNYINFRENQIISKRNLGSKGYKVLEEIPTIEWQLIPGKSKMINNFKSYKAEGNFRGRTYIAWYTPDVPSRMGPWKFHGLPGLILDIRDEHNKFKWTATQISYPYHGETKIRVPANEDLQEIAIREYVGLVEEHQLNEKKRKIARAPKGTRVISSTTERGPELVYEWEEE